MPRLVPDTFGQRIDAGGPLTLRVSSWLGGRRLSTASGLDRLQVVAQSWEISDTAESRASGELAFRVPNTEEWWPTFDEHPLATVGQRLWAQVGFGDERISVGWFRLLEDPEEDGAQLTVRAVGLTHEIDRARFLMPYQSPQGSTRAEALARLVAPIPVVLDAGVVDKPLPVYSQEEDRLQAVVDIVETWPARWYLGDDAALHVAPVWDDADPGEPTFELRGGPGGGLVQLRPRQQVVDPPNGFRVANVPEGDEPEVVGTWVVPGGPMRWAEVSGQPGPYGQKPQYFASALLPADEATLVRVAENMTRRGMRRKFSAEATCRPDPRLVLGDVGIAASKRVGIVSLCRLLSYRLSAREMSVQVALLGEVAR